MPLTTKEKGRGAKKIGKGGGVYQIQGPKKVPWCCSCVLVQKVGGLGGGGVTV